MHGGMGMPAFAPQRDWQLDTTESATATATSSSSHSCPDDILSLIFEQLPPIEQCITVSHLNRQWHDWSHQNLLTIHDSLQPPPSKASSKSDTPLALFHLPLWCIREAWQQLNPQQRRHATERSAFHGDLAALRFALEEGGGQHALSAEYCAVAAAGGQVGVLHYLRGLGCPWDAMTCRAAANLGRLEALRYAHEHGCPWDSSTCSAAATIEVVRYAHGNGCPWSSLMCYDAAERCRLDVLVYAHNHGCPWDSDTCYAAAKGGSVEVLKCLRAHGCPWDTRVCMVAARMGFLPVLQYAREQGCPWDDYTCKSAALGGHLELLRFAHDSGCPLDVRDCRAAAVKGGHAAIIAYLDGLPHD